MGANEFKNAMVGLYLVGMDRQIFNRHELMFSGSTYQLNLIHKGPFLEIINLSVKEGGMYFGKLASGFWVHVSENPVTGEWERFESYFYVMHTN